MRINLIYRVVQGPFIICSQANFFPDLFSRFLHGLFLVQIRLSLLCFLPILFISLQGSFLMKIGIYFSSFCGVLHCKLLINREIGITWHAHIRKNAGYWIVLYVSVNAMLLRTIENRWVLEALNWWSLINFSYQILNSTLSHWIRSNCRILHHEKLLSWILVEIWKAKLWILSRKCKLLTSIASIFQLLLLFRGL